MTDARARRCRDLYQKMANLFIMHIAWQKPTLFRIELFRNYNIYINRRVYWQKKCNRFHKATLWHFVLLGIFQ